MAKQSCVGVRKRIGLRRGNGCRSFGMRRWLVMAPHGTGAGGFQLRLTPTRFSLDGVAAPITASIWAVGGSIPSSLGANLPPRLQHCFSWPDLFQVETAEGWLGVRVKKKSDPLPSRFSQLGDRSLAVVVLQFTAWCRQRRSIKTHNQLGKPLELTSGDAIGSRSGLLCPNHFPVAAPMIWSDDRRHKGHDLTESTS
jgi:hypothetical protein